MQLGDIVRRRADVETVIHMALRRRQRQLFMQPFDSRRRRLRVRHFEKRRYASFGAGPRRRVQVFLVREARLAEMDLVVDDARQ